MTDKTIDRDDIFSAASNLSTLDRIQLVKQIMESIEQSVAEREQNIAPSLYGLWAGSESVTEEDIAEVRREMQSNFPREDAVVQTAVPAMVTDQCHLAGIRLVQCAILADEHPAFACNAPLHLCP